MQSAGVDCDLHGLSFLHLRASVETPDHGRMLLRSRLLHGPVVTEILCQLLDVVRERRRSIDCEVGDDLGAERLCQLHLALDTAVARHVRSERSVLEVLGADTEHDWPAL